MKYEEMRQMNEQLTEELQLKQNELHELAAKRADLEAVRTHNTLI